MKILIKEIRFLSLSWLFLRCFCVGWDNATLANNNSKLRKSEGKKMNRLNEFKKETADETVRVIEIKSGSIF